VKQEEFSFSGTGFWRWLFPGKKPIKFVPSVISRKKTNQVHLEKPRTNQVCWLLHSLPTGATEDISR
jgi:hypothetical protein